MLAMDNVIIILQTWYPIAFGNLLDDLSVITINPGWISNLCTDLSRLNAYGYHVYLYKRLLFEETNAEYGNYVNNSYHVKLLC